MRTTAALFGCLLAWSALVSPGRAAPGDGAAPSIPVEDYALYDQIVAKKFLTSDTRLVVVERMTVARLIPNQEEPLTAAQFSAQGFFDGELPADLVRDFLAVNAAPHRLEGRFQFGVRYRFISGDAVEEPEVRSAHPVRWQDGRLVQAPPVLDRLAFSRVGRTLRNDHALVYVENTRPDGTGAGFLIWLRRQGLAWTVYDTEVVWTVRQESPEEEPTLAP